MPITWLQGKTREPPVLHEPQLQLANNKTEAINPDSYASAQFPRSTVLTALTAGYVSPFSTSHLAQRANAVNMPGAPAVQRDLPGHVSLIAPWCIPIISIPCHAFVLV